VVNIEFLAIADFEGKECSVCGWFLDAFELPLSMLLSQHRHTVTRHIIIVENLVVEISMQ
jgi:hypothetical protein